MAHVFLKVRGSVAERSMAADCKSADVMPTVVQIHPSPQLYAGVAQLVEHQPSKLRVAGSSPVSRSSTKAVEQPYRRRSDSSVVERLLGKEEVPGSNPGRSSERK